MNKNHQQFIALFPQLSKKSPRMAQEILATANLISCPAKTRLYFEGDSCAQIAFLIDGEIRVFKSSEGGREITLYEIGPGETCILNASCILSDSKYPADAMAVSDCRMYMVPDTVLRRLIDRYDEMRFFVFSLLSNRLTGVMSLVEEVAFGRMDERLDDYLIEKSQDDVLLATHQVIANDLGTSREVVSRLLKDFERKGRVRLSRNRIDLLQG